ncbi:MAG: TonB-dependent receptor, partial [Sphingobacteriaceae bacterium]
MKKLLRALLCMFLCVFYSLLFAQQRKITGTVKDEAGKGLVGATVGVKGTQNQVATNDQGTFSINAAAGAVTLNISYSGLLTKEITAADNQSSVSVTLQASTSSIDNVVVVAYGRQKQATVTGSVSTVAGKELVSNSVSNISNMLVGNAPGLSGLQSSGEPGRNGANIFIRGVSTFSGNNNPLIVIDGVEQAAEQAFAQFNSIDANEIENISILKDASSSAVYGIRGANGVIIVTTKRGRIGKPTLSLSSNYGVTKATDLMHNVNSYQYAAMRNEAIRVEQSTFGSSGFNAYLFDANDLEKMRTNRDFSSRRSLQVSCGSA